MLVGTCLLLIAGLWIVFYFLKTSCGIPDKGYPIARTEKYGFSLQNTTHHSIRNFRFLARAPFRQTATQLCWDITASHQLKILSDGQENQILEFNFDALPPLSSKIVTVSAALKLADIPSRLDGPVESYKESGGGQLYFDNRFNTLGEERRCLC